MACSSATGDDRSGPPPGGDADLVFELHNSAQCAEFSRALTSLFERTPLTALQTRDFRKAVLEMAANSLESGGAAKARGPGPSSRAGSGPRRSP